jgi:capsule polysaccharide modification protein KpsS
MCNNSAVEGQPIMILKFYPKYQIHHLLTNTSTLKQYNRHAITKLKHIMQAKSRKGAVKETPTEVHVASASLSPNY